MLDQINTVFALVLFPVYAHFLVVDGIYLAATVIGLYGQVAAEAAVDEHQQLDLRGTAERLYGGERRADAPAGVKHVVYENHFLILYQKVDLGTIGLQRLVVPAEIVTEKSNVQKAQLDPAHIVFLLQYLLKAPGRETATGLQPNEHGIGKIEVLFN